MRDGTALTTCVGGPSSRLTVAGYSIVSNTLAPNRSQGGQSWPRSGRRRLVSVLRRVVCMARSPLRGLGRDLRHAARPHAGARQAGGGARPGPSPSFSTRRCASAHAAGRRSRCRRPTAPERSSPRWTCAATRRSSSTATAARGASRWVPTGRSARSRGRRSRRCASSEGPSRWT